MRACVCLFVLVCVPPPPPLLVFPQDKNNIAPFLPIYVDLFILCPPFVGADAAIILFVSRRGRISKGLIMQTGL